MVLKLLLHVDDFDPLFFCVAESQRESIIEYYYKHHCKIFKNTETKHELEGFESLLVINVTFRLSTTATHDV